MGAYHFFFFFFSSRRRHTRCLSDWSSDVCSSDLAKFLDITTPDAIWPQLVEAASFESMKREGGRLMPQLDSLLDRGHQNFFYKGTNSRWRGVLTDPDIDLYEQKIKAELSPALIRWLTDGRLVAGDPVASPD